MLLTDKTLMPYRLEGKSIFRTPDNPHGKWKCSSQSRSHTDYYFFYPQAKV